MCIGGWTGIHFGVRLEEANQCILVIIGAAAEGKKKLVVLADGFRESESSWKEILLDLKRRGLTIDPKLAVGDGALGFWKALLQVFGETRVQRCWVHKSANVLNKLPKHLQPKVKSDLHQVWMADTRENTYQPKYPKATEGTKELPRSTLKTSYNPSPMLAPKLEALKFFCCRSICTITPSAIRTIRVSAGRDYTLITVHPSQHEILRRLNI